jgi:3-phenylpropionate/trans-cinnamate dioxygenase ferredoxin subunit
VVDADELWIDACAVDEIDEEDVMRFDYGERTFAIYRGRDGTFHATDGLCTHERAHLADGLVIGDTIECPKHNGRFNFRTGEATRVPARIALRVHAVRVEAGRVLIKLR